MTLAEPIQFQGKKAVNGHGHLCKPMTDEDVNKVHDLARHLDGRPVPGVRMTEDEFEAWSDEDVRAEWVEKEVILLSPSNIPHIRLNGWLYIVMETIARAGKLGSTFIEPQIRLASVKQRRNPDIAFVATSRQKIIQDTYIDGAPDLVMEIVSPDSQVRDWHDKYVAYEQSGVREYWVIDQRAERIEAFALKRDGNFSRIKEADGRIVSKAVKPFYVRPEWLWKFPLPDPDTILKELGVRERSGEARR